MIDYITRMEIYPEHNTISSGSSFPFDDAFEVCDSENISTPRSQCSTDDFISDLTMPSHTFTLPSSSTMPKLSPKGDVSPCEGFPSKASLLRDVYFKPCQYGPDRFFDEAFSTAALMKKRSFQKLQLSATSESVSAKPPTLPLFSTSCGSRIGSCTILPPPNNMNAFLHKDILPLKPLQSPEDDGFYTATENILENFQGERNFKTIPSKSSKKTKKNNKKIVEPKQEEDTVQEQVEKETSGHLDCEVLIVKHGWDAESAALALKLEMDDEENSPEVNPNIHSPLSAMEQDAQPEADFITAVNKRNRRKKSETTTSVVTSSRPLDQHQYIVTNSTNFYRANGHAVKMRGMGKSQIVRPSIRPISVKTSPVTSPISGYELKKKMFRFGDVSVPVLVVKPDHQEHNGSWNNNFYAGEKKKEQLPHFLMGLWSKYQNEATTC